MKLSFDGKGINGGDEYMSRIATFTEHGHSLNIGPLLAAAPELLEALKLVETRIKTAFDEGFALPSGIAALEEEVRAAIARARAGGAYGTDTEAAMSKEEDEEMQGEMEVLRVSEEYDSAAEWCARRRLKGAIGDPLPANMAPDGALWHIQKDPEAFMKRVKEFAYGIAMEKTKMEAQ